MGRLGGSRMKNIILLSLLVIIPFTAFASTYYDLVELRRRLENIKDHVEYGEINEIEDEVDMALDIIDWDLIN